MTSKKTAEPPSRPTPDHGRYRPDAVQTFIVVEIDGIGYPGEVLGRNSSRLPVVFVREGGRYRQRVDASSVRAGE